MKGCEHMEKLTINEAINFTEEKLMNVLDVLLYTENIERYGEDTAELIEKAHSYIKTNTIDSKVQFELCDYCSDIGSIAGTYGYKEGFKEGIRLFRTLMKL